MFRGSSGLMNNSDSSIVIPDEDNPEQSTSSKSNDNQTTSTPGAQEIVEANESGTSASSKGLKVFNAYFFN